MAAKVKVTVPASTSNLGSGFDCFGLALQLFLTVTIESQSGHHEIILTGEGAQHLPTDESNLVLRSAHRLYEAIESPFPGLRITIDNEIPLSRGLGSSGAAIVAGLVGAMKLSEVTLPKKDLLSIACGIEGHPENAASSLFGGLTINCAEQANVQCSKIDVASELKAVVLIPDVPISTDEARQILPDTVTYRDAVFNLQRSALLANAFAKREYGALKLAMQDRLHQQYRKRLIPNYDTFETQGYENGALGICISGSGSSILGLAEGTAETLKTSWQRLAQELTIPARVAVLEIDNEGARAVAI
ncbi:homoserine kinase [bacterium]|nr:homoserine kinase [bacterium]